MHVPPSSPASAEVKALFHYPCHSFIVRSALEGHLGEVVVRGTSADATLSAQVHLGVFSVLAGCPNEELAVASASSVIVLVTDAASWAPLLAKHLPLHRPYTRYAMTGDSNTFDAQHLQQLVDGCPPEYAIVPITESIAATLASEDWSSDLTGNFCSAADFCRRGLGFVAIEKTTGVVAAGASTFAVCDAGIELEVDTAVEHQRRGLARACAAQLLLACKRKGWQVSWDAHVPHSAVLAEQLGYSPGMPYVAYTTDPPP